MHFSINLRLTKKFFAIVFFVVLVIAIVSIILFRTANNDPLPSNIKGQLSYKVIYPAKTSQIDSSSYKYQTDKKTLTFKVSSGGRNIVFTEQPAPDELGSDTQAYYPALGIHPYAQFRIALGLVALTKFYQSGNLKPVGQSAIMASQGTFLIAHSEKDLTNAQWKDLFDSLKITK